MKTHLTNRKNLISTFSILGLLLSVAGAEAQQKDSIKAAKAADREIHYPKNNVKINLSSLALNNYSFYVERSLSRKISFSAGYRSMPNTNLGEMSIIKKANEKFNEGDDLVEGMSRMHVGGNAYTAEFRFYGGKKPGARGFYLSLYGRYATFDHDYNYQFINANNSTVSVPITSKVNGLGAGILIGKQWLIAKRVTFDFYTIGGHYGKLSGTSKSNTDLSSLSAGEMQDLKEELDNILVIKDKPFLNSTVNSQGVTGKIDGPFAGIRGLGFSLGIAF